MDKKIFSVIIPIYNGAKTIELSLSSLISNREYLKEVIICDDRSTDNGIELAHQFDNMLPIVYVRVKDELPHGPGNARNAGIEVATGDWVSFLDCDDMYPMNAFADAYNSILLNKEEIDKVAEIIMSFAQYTIETNSYIVVKNEDPSYVHGYFYNRDFLNKYKIRFHKDIFIIEDGYFNLLVNATLRNENLSILRNENIIGYYWRIHTDHKGLSFYANPTNQDDTNHTIKARMTAVTDIIKRYGTMSLAGKYALKITIDSFLSAYFEYSIALNSNTTTSLNGLIKWNKKIIDTFIEVFDWNKEQILDTCSEESVFSTIRSAYESHFDKINLNMTLEEFYNLMENYNE